MRRIAIAFAVACLLVLSAAAQEKTEIKPVTYLAEFQVNPAKAGDFVGIVKKYHGPMFDGLMKDGTVLAWGLDTAMIHRENGGNFLFWFATADYAGMDKVFAELSKLEEKMSKEDQANLMGSTDFTKHHDHILRNIQMNISEAMTPGPVYTNYSSSKLMRGKGRDYEELYKKYTVPVLDALVADGSIIGYGLEAEDFHTEEPEWRFVWVVTPNLAAFDKLDAAFEAASAKLTPAERSMRDGQFREITVDGAHRDYFFRSVLIGGADMGAAAGAQ